MMIESPLKSIRGFSGIRCTNQIDGNQTEPKQAYLVTEVSGKANRKAVEHYPYHSGNSSTESEYFPLEDNSPDAPPESP